MDFKNIEKVKVTEGLDFLLLPRPVILVTALDQNDKPNIIIIAWATPVSHKPLVAPSSPTTRPKSSTASLSCSSFSSIDTIA